MKRLVSFLFVFVFCFISFSFIVSPYKITSSEGTNILSNGDFNLTADGALPFTYWQGSNIKVKNLKNGNYAVQSSTTSDVLVLYQNDLNLEAGKYNVKFQAQLAKSGNPVDISVRFISNNGTGSVASIATKNISNDRWEEVSFDLVLSENGLYQFNCMANEACLDKPRVYIDDMVLVRENGVKTAAGADLRTVKSSAGLRFKGTVDKNLYDGYVENYGAENVQVGMIIAPTDFLSDCDFTYEALSAGKAVQVGVATRWNNESKIATDGYYGFNCAFVNILPYNTDRRFSFRSFLRYTVGNKTTYIYSDYDETDNSRSVYELALAFREDESNFADYQVEVIKYFCNLIDYPKHSVNNDGNTFTLTFAAIKGYFVLDYDRSAYSLKNASIAIGDGAAKSFSGMEYVLAAESITITFTVDTAETLTSCPVRGKVYKIA